MSTPSILVTGANGYIGRAVIAAAEKAGYTVYALARRDTFSETVNFIPYDLAQPLPEGLPEDAAIIHLAYDYRVDNLRAAKWLMDHAAAHGNRLIFASSQTARADAPTLYGYEKWRTERLMLDARQIVVRPGMVYGGTAAGLYGTIKKLVAMLPILPDFRPAPLVQPVHVDDLASAFLSIATTETPGHEYNIGHSQPVSFTSFLRQLAHEAGLYRLFIPVPKILIEKLIQPSRRLPQGISQKLQSLKSLFDLPLMETTSVVPLRPFTIQDDKESKAAAKIFRNVTGAVKPEWVTTYLELSPQSLRARQLAALQIAQADPDATSLFNDEHHLQRLRSFITLPFVLLEELRQRILHIGRKHG